MAENESQPVDNVDALAAMAGGANLNEPDPFAGPEPAPPAEDPTQIPIGDGPSSGQATDEPVSFNAPPSRAGQPARRSAGKPAVTKKMQAQAAAAAYANQFKKIAVPLMLAIGVILLAISALCWFRKSLDLGEGMKYFALITLPMALILIVGAYWFHLDLSRQKK